MLENPEHVRDRLLELQREVRDLVINSRESAGLHEVSRASSADTIYAIDAAVDPILETFCEEWGKSTPLVLIAEGLTDGNGREVERRVFPNGALEDDAAIRVIVDPIDGTRGIMYDKRAAWSLAGVAPNKGRGTRLRDIEVAAMTELPTSKMGFADVLSTIKGQGVRTVRDDLARGASEPFTVRPSAASGIDHGFASVSNFFPGTKVLASELMEHLVAHLIGPADVTKATVFDDQYISTGGQFYELIAGHDRFVADLRPAFYRMQGRGAGMCCHPYDCAAWLVAEEAGVILTDERGIPLDGPLDTTSGISWVGYANDTLRQRIEPLLTSFFTAAQHLT
jgi:hypothetical protein